MMEAAASTPAIPEALAEATRHQPRARATLVAALASPSHAYIFRGPRGAGKAAAARAFAAELLAEGAPDPDDSRRRALLDPSPHPDLAWLRPPGAQHLVEDVRESVIRASNLSPAEGRRRVFVIEEAEDLRDESQNALLKTLEEPAPFAHLILICSEPELLAETILSRCTPVEFGPLAPDAVLEALGAGEEAAAAARLSGGDVELARLLLSERGAALRATAEAGARDARSPDPPPEPWRGLLDAASEAGQEAGAEEERRLVEEAEATARRGRKGKLTREATEQVKRTERRARTQALDLALALCCDWYRDLAAVASGADDVVLNADRREQLAQDAQGLDPASARSAVEWVLDTRRRLRVNVSEELALEALWLRLADALSG
ncbi:MAG: polymerase subunit delta [Solirubrobacterales bacterium]|nr:polymerase subunit delta [Solirubrobacterales bacterium]